nr:hypothetical protein [uncultured Desulfobacter sp.]
MLKKSFKTLAVTAAAAATIGLSGPSAASAGKYQYLPGDFHQHTYYTDGKHIFAEQQAECDYYLQWWANSEHGGRRSQDGENNKWDDENFHPGLEILGDYAQDGSGHQYMYRWQSLRDFVYPDIEKTRALYPDKAVISGLEWNVPGHEHCSTAIHQYDGTATALSEFEFRFDKADPDTSRADEASLLDGKMDMNKDSSSQEDALVGVKWMQSLYESGLGDAWVVPAHIERARAFIIEDFRAWKEAGPDVVQGFEGAPGHQASGTRGFGTSAVGGGTYGGSGWYCAKVGGLWDALSAEGIKWFNYASSDDHNNWRQGGSDFWPGEYQKNYTYIDTDKEDKIQAVFDGIRSGNNWHVEGDLIDELNFTAKSNNNVAMMGQTLKVKAGQSVQIKIKVHDPLTANECPLDMDNPSLAQIGISQPLSMPELDHIDLIAGTITGNVVTSVADNDETGAALEDTDYDNDAAVIRTFERREDCKDGYMTYVINIKPTESMFIRLRGTNLPANVPYETDDAGNPLADSTDDGAGKNIYDVLDNTSLASSMFDWVKNVDTTDKLEEVAEAFADLWFYSNPIYIEVEADNHPHKHHNQHNHQK